MTQPRIDVVNSTTARETEAMLKRVDGPVLQIGSRAQIVDRQENRWRNLVGDKRFLGLDLEAGENVDVVGDICGDFAALDAVLAGERFGFVLCSHVLEHTKKPWIAAENILRLMRPGGHCFLAVPWVQAYHGFPHDYWRISFHGLAELFPGLDILDAYYSASGTGFDVTYKVLVDGRIDVARTPWEVEAQLFQVLLDRDRNQAFLAEQAKAGQRKLLLARGYMPVTLVNLFGRKR